MNNLASTHRDAGRLKDAEALGVEVVEKRKRVLGDDHPDTLKSMLSLAATYRALDRLNDADALETVVEEHRKHREGRVRH